MRLQRFLSLWYETPKVGLSLVRDFAGWPLSGMRRRGLASLSKSHRWLASRARDVEGRTVAGTRSRRSDSLVETSLPSLLLDVDGWPLSGEGWPLFYFFLP